MVVGPREDDSRVYTGRATRLSRELMRALLPTYIMKMLHAIRSSNEKRPRTFVTPTTATTSGSSPFLSFAH